MTNSFFYVIIICDTNDMGWIMAVLFESDSYIELLLKKALQKENLTFTEQYRLYTGGRFSEVKYVADFLITYNSIKLIVECDGNACHSGRENRAKKIKRDLWLIERGYKVSHFTYDEIKWHMNYVIDSIKFELKINSVAPVKPKIIKNNIDKNSYDVLLYLFYIQKNDSVFLTYKYFFVSKNIWSEERKKICKSVPENMFEATAFYLALLDLKRSVKINIFYSGSIINDKYNVNKTIRTNLLKFRDGKKILDANKLSLFFFNLQSKEPKYLGEPRKVMTAIKSRCLQISNENYRADSILSFSFKELL